MKKLAIALGLLAGAAPLAAQTPDEVAAAALREAPVWDGHNDVPIQLRERRGNVIAEFDFNDTRAEPDGKGDTKPMHTDFPRLEQEGRARIADRTADFAYLRCKNLHSEETTGYAPSDIERIAGLCRAWAVGEAPEGLPYAGNPADSRGQDGDVFAFMINGAKERAPAAALALAERTKGSP